jgi:2-dehydropantoate 2-reductase
MDVVVFGAGSLGSLVGGLLAGGHDVTLVGRDPHVSAVRERGLRLEGAVETTVRPDAVTDPPAAADLAVACVKAADTAAAREVGRVADAEGVDLSPDAAAAAVERVAAATAANTSSMRQDVEAGRRTEADAIGGYVWERADEHGVDVPVNTTMTRLLRAWEAERGLR